MAKPPDSQSRQSPIDTRACQDSFLPVAMEPSGSGKWVILYTPRGQESKNPERKLGLTWRFPNPQNEISFETNPQVSLGLLKDFVLTMRMGGHRYTEAIMMRWKVYSRVRRDVQRFTKPLR